jgi:hypothetical protein
MAVFLFFFLPAKKKRETQYLSASISARAIDFTPITARFPPLGFGFRRTPPSTPNLQSSSGR